MQKIVLASNNPGKIKEFQAIFSSLNLEIIPQAKFNLSEVDEPFPTFIENALHKARQCSLHTGLSALADDSGLCVNSLNGQPGIYSARYAGSPKNDLNNNQKLVHQLQGITDKSAYYYCILVLIRHHLDPQPIIAEGKLAGSIVDTPQGNNGFGYDSHFYLPDYQQTMAQLNPNLKNQISHRAIAVKHLLTQLNNL